MKYESTAQTPQDLLNDLRTLISEAQTVVGRAASAQSDNIISALQMRLEAARERFGGLVTNATKKIVATAKSADETVRTNLYLSIAIAFGIGFSASLLVSRRGHC